MLHSYFLIKFGGLCEPNLKIRDLVDLPCHRFTNTAGLKVGFVPHMLDVIQIDDAN